MSLSAEVHSSQTGPHENLEALVRRYAGSETRKPIAEHTGKAFAWLAEQLEPGRELIFDSGCGTGESTRQLACRYPQAQVVGIDQSSHRLARGGWRHPGTVRDNRLLLRAELGDLWRLASQAGWRLRAHYLLYPNPWPKPGQLQRRWHAHPAFPSLLALGGELVLRTNWDIYAREFALALEWSLGLTVPVTPIRPESPMTPFERKYQASGHGLFEVRCLLA
ncbi:MAG: hypothetical protein QNJ40_21850 [Xanthomonadales bacterium]|nr:hypothetical protein [Xanthomonadales bacterium]